MFKTNASSKSIDGVSISKIKTISGGNPTTTNVKTLSKLKNLYTNIGDPLTIIMNNYINKQFTEVTENIKTPAYTQMIRKIFNVKLTSLPEFEKVRVILVDIMGMLSQGSFQYKEKIGLKQQLDAALERAGILDDMDLLQEFINNLNTEMSLFGNVNVTFTTQATIAPEYVQYINLYGYPENHIFNPELLGQILNQLN